MSRKILPPRLYLRKSKGNAPEHWLRMYVILDRGKEISTGCDETQKEKAEFALLHYRGTEALRGVYTPMFGNVYFLEALGLVKIGFATSLKRRVAELSRCSPVPLHLMGSVRGSIDLERDLHRDLAEYHSHAEWFFLTDEVRETIERLLRPNLTQETREREANESPVE